MNSSRLQAFSDGVIAIIITILVFNLKPPESTHWASLSPLLTEFAAHVLTFLYVGIYWNNHHHLWQIASRVSGRLLWANSHLLFWLSLLPLASAWVGKSPVSAHPVAFYGLVLFLSSLAWLLLTTLVAEEEVENQEIQHLFKVNLKAKLSLLAYLLGMAAAFTVPALSLSIYFLVALAWFMPDKRVEAYLKPQRPHAAGQ
ncbi:TMEM175 family protein [Ideonella sp.]|jgi:uncharacterized membrane protein|uniref:TMEM175 family protein n=1 Tax=Ideonella sp. TaxID=1929293 RepID=UPI0037BE6E72